MISGMKFIELPFCQNCEYECYFYGLNMISNLDDIKKLPLSPISIGDVMIIFKRCPHIYAKKGSLQSGIFIAYF
ncbi:MAG: hypothetical protein C4323_16865 [Mastigocladus sp. ERB_26_2]